MKRAIILAISLIGISFCILIYKISVSKYIFTTEPSSPVWRVRFTMQFDGQGKKAQVGLLLPQNSPRQRIYEEMIKANGFRFHIKEIESGNNRRGWWEKKKLKHKETIAYEFSVKVNQSYSEDFEVEETELEEWLKESKEEINGLNLRNLVFQLTEGVKNKEKKANIFFHYVKDDIDGSSKEKAKFLCALLRVAGIPSMMVGGIVLEEGKRNIHFWVEAFLKDKKVSFCPINGYVEEIPSTYLVLYHDDLSFIKKRGVKNFEYLISVEKEKKKVIEFISQIERKNIGENKWSLSSLPLSIQQKIRLFLVIPLGALTVSIFRNIVGVNTFGTFTPILMALAFRETGLIWGFFLFSLVITIGYFFRSILDRLKLLFIPRLSIILTLIIAVLIISISVGYHIKLEMLSSISLFPIVIMTMLVERFSIIQIEAGTKASIFQYLGTVVVSCFGYLLISSGTVQLIMFFFPELILAIVGILLLIGKYTGLRLTEIWRFRPLGRG